MNTKTKFGLIEKSINNCENRLSIKELCGIAGVSRSGFYNWRNSANNRLHKIEEDKKDFEEILKIYKLKRYKKGAKSIYMQLLQHGKVMNIKKIRRLMKEYNLVCPIRKKNPYKQYQKFLKTDKIADNLVNRQFTENGFRKVLLTDITYIHFKEKFVYLSTILDAHTRQILAYRISETLKLDFVLDTLSDLTYKHGQTLSENTIIHSDQGCHYTSIKFINLVKNMNLRQSMSRRGNCWDNAPQESFFGHMKDEISDIIKNENTFSGIKHEIDLWMDYYNNDRCQWNLNKCSPNDYYDKFCLNTDKTMI